MILLNPARWKNFHLPAAALGGILGGLPLIFANWLSFSRTHILISLQLSDYSFDISFIDHLRGYLSSGAGNLVQAFILGRNANVFGSLEMVLLLAILLLIIVQMIRYRSMEKQIRNMFVLLISYFAIMIQTYVFFHTIHLGVHHWILGTPFQYIAIALFISNWEEKTVVFKKKLFKYLVMALLIFFSLSRIAGLASMEDSLTRGDSTIAWDASLNRFAQFAASKSDSAYFLTTDWVEKNQLTCFMNGNDSSVLHRRVVGYPTVPQLFDTVKKSNRTELYILFPVPATALYLTPSEKQMILDEASRELSPEWQMVPVDKQFSNLRALEIVKYQKKKISLMR
jgi:hypothetical protein